MSIFKKNHDRGIMVRDLASTIRRSDLDFKNRLGWE